MKCPICQTPVAAEGPEYPFCSQRCRTQDLANWASGVYRIPTPERPGVADDGDQE